MILSIILQLILLGFLITQLSPATKGPAVPVVLATLQPLAACSKQYVGFTVSKLQFLWNMDRSRTSRWIHPVFYATDFNHGQVPMGVNVADNNKTIWQRVYPLKIPQLSENVGAEKHVRPCTVHDFATTSALFCQYWQMHIHNTTQGYAVSCCIHFFANSPKMSQISKVGYAMVCHTSFWISSCFHDTHAQSKHQTTQRHKLLVSLLWIPFTFTTSFF